MVETTLQFAIGAALFCVVLAFDRRHVRELMEACFPKSEKLQSWTKAVTRVAVGALAAACLLDPMIPGLAHLTVSIPAGSSVHPTTSMMDNLRVRIVPTGAVGDAGGARTEYAALDVTGSADIVAKMTFLETAVNLQLFDQTQPGRVLRSMTIYVSPFVRRQLFSKKVVFEGKDDQ